MKLPKISNSTLTKFKDWLHGNYSDEDMEPVFRIGNLFDALITQPDKIDLFKMKYKHFQDEFIFSKSEYNQVLAMKKSYDDFLCENPIGKLMRFADYQKTFKSDYWLNDKIGFSLKSIYDITIHDKVGIDIKTTHAKKREQFINGCLYLDYDRARYLYTQASNMKQDYIIGVCVLPPYPIHFIDCFREGWMQSGKEKMDNLLLQYYYYFC